ncbi:MAG: hypothetical protein ACTSVO_04215 [Candidatus Heimdallarchaeaceae archaeon]
MSLGLFFIIDVHFISRGYNRRVQNNSLILHAEMDRLENAKRLTNQDSKKATFYIPYYHLFPCVAELLYCTKLLKLL